MIHLRKPDYFKPEFETVGCLCEHNQKILLLKRNSSKNEGDKWGMPAGKVELGEKLHEAMIRELEEETTIKKDTSEITFFKSLYVRYPNYDFMFHMFHTHLKKKPAIAIQDREHTDYMWITPDKSLELEMVKDADDCIKLFYRLDA